jgi:eukaryotic-like serine/threonine-protein kinase
MMLRTPVASEPVPPSPDIAPGTLLAGKYRVDRVIGRGGMGLVVAARHIALNERVALKFLLPEFAAHPEAATRFLREAQAAVRIKSEHVARISDVGTLDTGAPYMVMELLDGADLSKDLKTSVLLIPDAVDFIIQVSDVIAEAHAHGIGHRDIKPANLFLTHRADDSPLVKVLDFGISKVIGGEIENLTKTDATMGSVRYMSPEQMREARAVDHRTDIYALGVSLYELLGGEQPFRANTLPQLCAEVLSGVPTPLLDLRPEVPVELVRVIEKAFARERGERHQSVAELVLALAPFAPSRSQREIERICRMGGLEVATPGAAAAVGSSRATGRAALDVTGPLPMMSPPQRALDSAAGGSGTTATVPVRARSGDAFVIERRSTPSPRETAAASAGATPAAWMERAGAGGVLRRRGGGGARRARPGVTQRRTRAGNGAALVPPIRARAPNPPATMRASPPG